MLKDRLKVKRFKRGGFGLPLFFISGGLVFKYRSIFFVVLFLCCSSSSHAVYYQMSNPKESFNFIVQGLGSSGSTNVPLVSLDNEPYVLFGYQKKTDTGDNVFYIVSMSYGYSLTWQPIAIDANKHMITFTLDNTVWPGRVWVYVDGQLQGVMVQNNWVGYYTNQPFVFGPNVDQTTFSHTTNGKGYSDAEIKALYETYFPVKPVQKMFNSCSYQGVTNNVPAFVLGGLTVTMAFASFAAVRRFL